MKDKTIDRRFLLLGGGATLLLGTLAGCGTLRPVGDGARMTRDAAPAFAEIRRFNALGAIRADSELETAALEQAAHMARNGKMTHDTGRGRDFAARMGGVTTNGAAAENLARGRFDTARVMSVWMNSPGHRRNMLDPRFSRFGLAYVADPTDAARRYWTMVLAA
ncbi:CAP domain-containing protein [Aliihoeflea sp. PC F10.4]